MPPTPNAAAPPADPAVSVLIAVHDGARYLETALRSLLDQSLREIEIVAVDDGSTDATPAILARLAAADPRLRVIRAPQNLRLAGALNLGLDHVRAPLVARMDDDDIALPERLAIQKRFLDTRPDITLLGTSFEAIDGAGRVLSRSVRARDGIAIGWALRFSPNVSHPSFMFRRQLPDGRPVRYDTDLPLSQDYGLLCEVALAGGGLACLPDVLLRYRKHEAAVSVARLAEQRAIARRIGTGFQKATLPPALFDALAPLRAAFWEAAPATPDRVAAIFAGARAMLAHDIAAHPHRAAWLRRQTAQLIPWILQRAGASGGRVAAGFLRHGPDLLPAMALRAMELKNLLPARLSSEPDLSAPPALPAP